MTNLVLSKGESNIIDWNYNLQSTVTSPANPGDDAKPRLSPVSEVLLWCCYSDPWPSPTPQTQSCSSEPALLLRPSPAPPPTQLSSPQLEVLHELLHVDFVQQNKVWLPKLQGLQLRHSSHINQHTNTHTHTPTNTQVSHPPTHKSAFSAGVSDRTFKGAAASSTLQPGSGDSVWVWLRGCKWVQGSGVDNATRGFLGVLSEETESCA